MDTEGCEQTDRQDTTNEESEQIGDAQQDITHRNAEGSEEFYEDFTCAVCFHLAVQPTSLTCGHTFCRICLARWYGTSGKKKCPLCGQAFQGHPKINIHIQNMMTKLCPGEVREREESLRMNEEHADTLRRFEEDLSDKNVKNIPTTKAFCYGFGFALFAFLVAYLAWYWQLSETDLLVSKPVPFWTPWDVKAWLEKVHWASMYSNKSIESNIDGNRLVDMNDESLLQILNISDPDHQRDLISSVAFLKEHGIKVPETIWEYKDLYLGRCVFLAYGLRQFPRVTILCTWMYYYDEIFLPFVKATTEQTDKTETTSTSQWITFLFYALLLPQWLVIVAANGLLWQQCFPWLVIITNAIVIQLLETLQIISYFTNNNLEERVTIQTLVHYGKHLTGTLMMVVIWPVIPKIVADLIIFVTLFIRPFVMIGAIYKKLRFFNNPQFVAQ